MLIFVLLSECTNLAALDTSSSKFDFIALAAVNVFSFWHKTLSANRNHALAAEETGLVPLLSLVL